jgi:hypothetical protein
MGGHLDVCLDCGHEHPSYNSCGNRNCPKCQALAQARWVEQRRKRILPVACFHLVFTLPAELRSLVLLNRRLAFNLLFRAVATTLQTLARDSKRLGAQLGFTLVLHTWTRDLGFHPHLHCIVTAGGLSPDGSRWISSRDDYLFPIGVLSDLFRGKFLSALTAEQRSGHLNLPDQLAHPQAFEGLRQALFDKHWHVYAKRPFASPDHVFSYLGMYTHRVAISNHRILSVTDSTVTIRTRNDETASMSPHEFIRRFLNHVLPSAFVKIRHYGLLASANVNTKLEKARALLLADSDESPPPINRSSDDWKTLFLRVSGVDVRLCPACGSTRIRSVAIPPTRLPTPRRRAPPELQP